MACQHNHTVGDNYGITCADCGAILAGYGYWGEGSRTCNHLYVSNGEGRQVCLYCEDEIVETREVQRDQFTFTD